MADANPFEDLIPQRTANPFGDLIPAKTVNHRCCH
jgi:hypothetical protein